MKDKKGIKFTGEDINMKPTFPKMYGADEMKIPKTVNGEHLIIGQFYKTRNGDKCEITSISSDKVYLNTNDGIYKTSVCFDGFWNYNKIPNGYDLMSPWVDNMAAPKPVPSTENGDEKYHPIGCDYRLFGKICNCVKMLPDEAPSIQDTLSQRGERYGEFKDHAVIAQNLKQTMQDTEGWKRLNPSQKESLEMIQHKIARILNGDPNYVDSWHDIAGYATLVEKILNAPDS